MRIRDIQRKDRSRLEAILQAQEHFKPQEVKIALELIDVALEQPGQEDYRIQCIEASDGGVHGYVCYGKAPLTDAVYDLYWIVVHPASWNQGMGSALLRHAEEEMHRLQARLLLIETSSLATYAAPRVFYERHGYEEKAKILDYYALGEHKLVYGKALPSI